MDLKLSRSDFDAVGNYVGKFDLTQTYDGDIVVIDDEGPWTGVLTVPALKATGCIHVVACVDISIEGDVEAGGSISADSGSLKIGGNLGAADWICAYGALTVAGNVETGGSITFGSLTVAGNLNAKGTLTGGELRVDGELRIWFDLYAGEAWIGAYDIGGILSVQYLNLLTSVGEERERTIRAQANKRRRAEAILLETMKEPLFFIFDESTGECSFSTASTRREVSNSSIVNA